MALMAPNGPTPTVPPHGEVEEASCINEKEEPISIMASSTEPTALSPSRKRKRSAEGDSPKEIKKEAPLNGIPPSTSSLNPHNSTIEPPRQEGVAGAPRPKAQQGQGRPVEPAGRIRLLTLDNIQLLDRMMAARDPTPRSYSFASQSTQSMSETSAIPSSKPSQSFKPTNTRYKTALRDSNVDFSESERPKEEDLAQLVAIMEQGRASPEPDRETFHEVRRLVERENEATVMIRISPLLFPTRDTPHNNHKTKHLFYRYDSLWQDWCSAQPGVLPAPKPDLCISFKRSTFSAEERKLLTCPYADLLGYVPILTCEVTTTLQRPEVADRQNANNMLTVLERDYGFQSRLGQVEQTLGRIRAITTAHDTRGQWYDAWFYILERGQPRFCRHRLKTVNFDSPDECGFERARRYNLNLCEYLEQVLLPRVQADVAKAVSLTATSTTEEPSTETEGPRVEASRIEASRIDASTTPFPASGLTGIGQAGAQDSAGIDARPDAVLDDADGPPDHTLMPPPPSKRSRS